MSLLRRIGRGIGIAVCTATLLTTATTRIHAQASPKMQLPADQRAFNAARSISDPAQRLAAMRQFVKNYPRSTRKDRAESDILDTLLKYYPERGNEIDEQARIILKSAGKGLSKLYNEIDIANSLAEAGKSGVDLTSARKWAEDAESNSTEAKFDKERAAINKKYKQPSQDPASLHASFASARSSALSALAKVDLDEDKLPQAVALLDEAYALDPTGNEVNLLRGEVALENHRDADALEAFERAQLAGELKSPWREKMMELYRRQHNNSDAGFVAEMDARYAQLFPETFTPKIPEPASTGRTALLELFTGSACDPCVSADLAVDALLKSYPRQDLVALSFDQHIPEPDPLANPDSVARAAIYDIPGTPTYVLNGHKLSPSGGSRRDSEARYNAVSKLIDAEAIPSGVQLKLTAQRTPNGLIQANASVAITNPQQLQQALTAKPAPSPDDPKTPAPAAVPAATPPAPINPHLVINFALVEDDIRYSGENGIRFHRMVVRSLAQPADSGFPVEPGKTFDATFDPAQISSKLKDYLNAYEVKNDRFGKVEFLSKDTTIQPNRIAVAAWVQDTNTHRVLQAAFIPLGQE
jgi:hypothetical protein